MVINLRKAGIICAAVLVLTVSLNALVGGCLNTSGDSSSAGKETVSSVDVKSSTNTEIPKSQVEHDFFSEYRLERERIRGKQIEMLREIASDPNNDKEARQAASLRLVQITEDMEKEMKVESLVKSKGFKECVVIINPHSTTVIVETDNLRLDKEEEIKRLVSQAIQYNKENLSVIAREPQG